MIRITTPATSANLGVGFDSIALAVSIYNTYVFETSDTTKLIGFESEFSNLENLVYKAYVAFAKQHGQESSLVPVTITLEQAGIPFSRGLGSSASCILAGVLASNILHDIRLSESECVRFAALYEGHPDNVYACMYGLMTAVYQEDNQFYSDTYVVAPEYVISVLIPNQLGQTKQLRTVLPKQVDRNDAVFHLSRTIHLPRAFAKPDINALKRLLKDRLHESYRYPSIPNYEQVQIVKQTLEGILLISGSGPSLLVLSDHDVSSQLEVLQPTYRLVEVKPSQGTTVEVIE